jgi:antitoxin PrlF
MSVSTLTRKGQTTIPKDVRKFLGLEPEDKILYLIEGEKVILKPLKGNILELRGSVPAKKESIDFNKLRQETKRKVARNIAEEAK